MVSQIHMNLFEQCEMEHIVSRWRCRQLLFEQVEGDSQLKAEKYEKTRRDSLDDHGKCEAR